MQSDCCSTGEAAGAPVDVSAALAADPDNAPAPQDDPAHACASCRGASRPVTRKTVLLMLRPELLESVGEGEYRFCPDSECRVVYFTEGGGRSFTTVDLRVRVGLKEREGEIPLCYCFGFDEAGAREEIRRTGGSSSVPRRIAALIKQGMCACPAKNPSGACCLGEVNKAIKRLEAETAGAGQPA
jgi:hypothetical protein